MRSILEAMATKIVTNNGYRIVRFALQLESGLAVIAITKLEYSSCLTGYRRLEAQMGVR